MNASIMLFNTILHVVQKRLGENFNSSKRYIIALQGASSSGKTTVANQLDESLKKNNICSLVINLDNFYKTPDNPAQEDENYDFDNPASLNWDKIFNVFKAIRDYEPVIPMLNRRTDVNQEELRTFLINPYPQVIIVEGIYGFNCVNKLKFNLDEFDANNTKKQIKAEYVHGEDVIGDMKVLKIFLPLCKNKFKSIRTARDLKVNKPLNLIQSRFEEMIWPDTQKWVYSSNESNDIHVVHGNFNTDKMNLVQQALLTYFTNTGKFVSGNLENNHLKDYKMTKCSGECLHNKASSLIISDEEVF